MFYHRQQVLNNTNFHIASRGGFSNNHPGNKASRELARQYATAYNATKKSDRPAFARQLYQQCLKHQRIFVIERDYFLRRFVQDKADSENPAPRRKGGRRKLAADRTLSIVRANGGDIDRIRSLPPNVFIATGDAFAVGSLDHLLRDEARKARESMGTANLHGAQNNNNDGDHVCTLDAPARPVANHLIRQVSTGCVDQAPTCCDSLLPAALQQPMTETTSTANLGRLQLSCGTKSTDDWAPLFRRNFTVANERNSNPFDSRDCSVGNMMRGVPSSRFLQFVNQESMGQAQSFNQSSLVDHADVCGNTKMSQLYRSAFLSHSCSSLFDSTPEDKHKTSSPLSERPQSLLLLESLDEDSFPTFLQLQSPIGGKKNCNDVNLFEPTSLTADLPIADKLQLCETLLTSLDDLPYFRHA